MLHSYKEDKEFAIRGATQAEALDVQKKITAAVYYLKRWEGYDIRVRPYITEHFMADGVEHTVDAETKSPAGAETYWKTNFWVHNPLPRGFRQMSQDQIDRAHRESAKARGVTLTTQQCPDGRTVAEQDAADLLRRLKGVRLLTIKGGRNTIRDVSPPNAIVATDRSPEGQPVPIQQVQDALDRLLKTGEIKVSVPSLGRHSSFIGAVLLTLPGALAVPTAPPRIQLADPETANWLEQPGSGLGTAYREAQVSTLPESREPFTVDPALVERGLRGHADTQNELARVLRNTGIEPRSPLPEEPNFDLAWQNSGTVFVAEVKSTTDDNEEEQLRLGLGQVLRYRQRLTALGYERVVAVLVPERPPTDNTWAALCQELEVILLSGNNLDSAPVLSLDPPADFGFGSP